MNKNWFSLLRAGLSFLLVMFLVAGNATAGPPLICHAFDIGSEKSLPWISHGWNLSGAEKYDTHNLAADTVAILDASRVTLVHMETLRRATLYARNDRLAAKQLLLRLTARAEAAQSTAQGDALAVFDAGYLAEAYKQWLGEAGQNPANGIDGYALVLKAVQLRRNDSQMEFAAALIAMHGRQGESQEYGQKAIEGAKSDALLARNLSSRFLGPQSPTMAELISNSSETRVARQ